MAAAELYTVTVKFELRHTRGELVPSVEEVQRAVEGWAPDGDELRVHVSREEPEPKVNEGTGDVEPHPDGSTITRVEGCRVLITEAEVQEAKVR